MWLPDQYLITHQVYVEFGRVDVHPQSVAVWSARGPEAIGFTVTATIVTETAIGQFSNSR